MLRYAVLDVLHIGKAQRVIDTQYQQILDCLCLIILCYVPAITQSFINGVLSPRYMASLNKVNPVAGHSDT